MSDREQPLRSNTLFGKSLSQSSPTYRSQDFGTNKRQRTENESIFFSNDEDSTSSFSPPTRRSVRPVQTPADKAWADDFGRQLRDREENSAHRVTKDTLPTSNGVASPATHRSPSVSVTGQVTTRTTYRSPSPEIKIEKEEAWAKDLDSNDTVHIYIGTNNLMKRTHRSALLKSPVLTSFIVDDQLRGAYIMNPHLMGVDIDIFDSLVCFMHAGEYAPILMTPDVEGQKHSLYCIEADHKKYSADLVRQGRIYMLAKAFQVQGLAELVRKKVMLVDGDLFDTIAVIKVATVVFGKESVQPAISQTQPVQPAEEDVQLDELEAWIVERLAADLRFIMDNRAEREAYWLMEIKTRDRKLVAYVLEKVAANYRENGNLGADVVELD